MLRIGLIGCGHIGTVHSFALRQLGRRRARRRAHHRDLRHRPRARPPGRRITAPRCRRALDAAARRRRRRVDLHLDRRPPRRRSGPRSARGLAVFCEKPLAPTLADCAERSPRAARARPAPGRARAAARAGVPRPRPQLGRLGRLRPADGAVLRDDQYFPIQGMYGSTWRADVDKAGGGTLIEHSIHDLDVLQWILGPADAGRARTASRLFGYPGIDDVARVPLAFAGGATATLVSVWHQVSSRPSTRRLELFCEDAFLWTEDDYLGPLHVETSAGTRSSWASRRRGSTGSTRPRGAGQAAGPVRRAEQGVPRRPGPRTVVAAPRRSPAWTSPSPPTRWSTAAYRSAAPVATGPPRRRAPGRGRERPALRDPGACARRSTDAAFRGRAADPPGDRGEPDGDRSHAGAAGLRDDPVPPRGPGRSSGRSSASSPASSSCSSRSRSVLVLGVVGFLVMLACLLVIERNVRKLGKAGMENLTGSLRGGALEGHARQRRAPLARALAAATTTRPDATPGGLHRAPRPPGSRGARPRSSTHWERIGLVAPPRRRRSVLVPRPRRAAHGRVAARRRALARAASATRSPTSLGVGEDIAGLRLVTDGDHVWACRDDGQILDALGRGQLALFVAVDRFAAEVEAEVRDVRRRAASFVDELRSDGGRSDGRGDHPASS